MGPVGLGGGGRTGTRGGGGGAGRAATLGTPAGTLLTCDDEGCVVFGSGRVDCIVGAGCGAAVGCSVGAAAATGATSAGFFSSTFGGCSMIAAGATGAGRTTTA